MQRAWLSIKTILSNLLYASLRFLRKRAEVQELAVLAQGPRMHRYLLVLAFCTCQYITVGITALLLGALFAGTTCDQSLAFPQFPDKYASARGQQSGVSRTNNQSALLFAHPFSRKKQKSQAYTPLNEKTHLASSRSVVNTHCQDGRASVRRCSCRSE